MSNSHDNLNNHDDATTVLAIFGLIVMFFLLIYWLGYDYIGTVLISLSRLTVSFMSGVYNIPEVGHHIGRFLLPSYTYTELGDYGSILNRITYFDLSPYDHLELLAFICSPLRPFVFLLVLITIVSNIKKQRVRSFKTEYSFQRLAHTYKKFEPHLIPPLSVDLLSLPADEGTLARAKPPLRYCIEHELIQFYGFDNRNEIDTSKRFKPTFSKIKGAMPGYAYINPKMRDPEGQSSLFKRCVLVDDEKLKKHFIEQLGEPLNDVMAMSKPRKILLAMCMLMSEGRTAGGIDRAYEYKDRVNRSFKVLKQYKNFTFKCAIAAFEADKIIAQHINNHEFKQAYNTSMYELTFLVKAIKIARTKGKFYTSHNYWLKYFDRQLFLTFNQTGTPTAWVECAAIRDQENWENQITDIRLSEPQVDSAVSALKRFMTSSEAWVYVPEGGTR